MHLLFKFKHSLVTVSDKILRCVWHGMLLVEKLRDVETADIHIKVNVAPVKIRREGFPQLRVRIQALQLKPDPFADAPALRSVLHKQQVKMIMLGAFVENYNRTTHRLSVDNSLVGGRAFCV